MRSDYYISMNDNRYIRMEGTKTETEPAMAQRSPRAGRRVAKFAAAFLAFAPMVAGCGKATVEAFHDKAAVTCKNEDLGTTKHVTLLSTKEVMARANVECSPKGRVLIETVNQPDMAISETALQVPGSKSIILSDGYIASGEWHLEIDAQKEVSDSSSTVTIGTFGERKEYRLGFIIADIAVTLMAVILMIVVGALISDKVRYGRFL